MAKQQQLSARSLVDLARSGLDADDAQRLGIAPIPTGFAVEGYRIWYHDLKGTRFEFYRDRLLDSPNRKYDQPRGIPPHLYIPPLPRPLRLAWAKIAKDATVRLFVVEGEKKAAALCKCGLAAIGIGGVACWRAKGGRLPQWDEIKMAGREVAIVFDSDIVDKPQVRSEELALAAELVAMGARRVQRVRLPQSV